MTRHNDDAHALPTTHGAQTRHNGSHPPRPRRSDDAHDEAHTRNISTRHTGCTPLGVRRADVSPLRSRVSIMGGGRFSPGPAQEKNAPPTEIAGKSGQWHCRRAPGKNSHAERSQEMPETSDWQVIGQVPIDTGRLALVDPMNTDDVSLYEMDEPGAMTYEVVTNDYGVGVAVLLGTGLGDGLYPVEARFEEAEGAKRIAEVRVRFLPHPVIGYELPR
jgi:hypothetical protein